MKRTKEQKGITLVALIITIIVLLILAVVAIAAVSGDGIIQHAKDSTANYKVKQAEEAAQLILDEWKIVKHSQNSNFETFLAAKANEGKVQAAVDNGDGTWTLTIDGQQVKVTESAVISSIGVGGTGNNGESGNEGETGNGGTQVPEAEIEINTVKIVSSADGTGEEVAAQSIEDLTTKLYISISASIEGGEITSVKQGETEVSKVEDIYVYEVEAGKNASYEFTITSSTGKTKTITKAVTQYVIPIAIGTCVEYDVSYIDMFNTHENAAEYTKTTGWRYLGKDSDGNKLLISTAIPAILNYNYKPGDTLPTWWATDGEITAEDTPSGYKTTAGWDYDNSGYPNKYAAYGLRYKFTQIPFTYKASGTSVSTSNTGIFRKVGNTTGEGTSLSATSFIDSDYVDKIVDVHNLTEGELSKANNNSTIHFKNLDGTAKGLFDMSALDNYTGNWFHWLASPDTRGYVRRVDYQNNACFSDINRNYGVRPVVTLRSDVILEDRCLSDGTPGQDGVLEIY